MVALTRKFGIVSRSENASASPSRTCDAGTYFRYVRILRSASGLITRSQWGETAQIGPEGIENQAVDRTNARFF